MTYRDTMNNPIVSVDFDELLIGIRGEPEHVVWVRCENVSDVRKSDVDAAAVTK